MSKVAPAVAQVRPSFVITPLLAELLNDDVVTKKIAVAGPAVDLVLAQLQLDIVTEENKDAIGPTCLALRLVRDAFATFKAKGEAVLQSELENKQTP